MNNYALDSKYLWKPVPQWICLSAAEKIRGIIKFFLLQTQFAEAAFQKRVANNTANIYVNQFLRTGNCLPRKQGGANHVVMSDWIEAYIEALLLCNPMLYLSEIRERVEDDLQLQPHQVPSLSAICLCIQRLNFTSKKIVKIPMERYTAENMRRRETFINWRKTIDPTMIFFTETGYHVNMYLDCRKYARSRPNEAVPIITVQRGQRAKWSAVALVRYITFYIRCKSSELLLLLIRKQMVAPRK